MARWVWTVAVSAYRWTYGPSRWAWSESRWPPSFESTFIRLFKLNVYKLCQWMRRDGRTINIDTVITFRMSRRRREIYCGKPRLCDCLSVRGRTPTLLRGPGCNLGEW